MKKTIIAIALSLIASNAFAQCVKNVYPEQTVGSVIVLQPYEARLIYSTQYPVNTSAAKTMFWTSHVNANLLAPGAVTLYGYTYQNQVAQLYNRVNNYEANLPIVVDLIKYPYAVYGVNTTNVPQPLEFSLSVEICHSER